MYNGFPFRGLIETHQFKTNSVAKTCISRGKFYVKICDIFAQNTDCATHGDSFY